MTRINVGIPPSQLTNKHLLAEHREIKRIPNMVKSGRAKMNGIPPKFTLGKGHVKFFYDKLKYLLERYIEIHAECVKRKFNVQFYGSAWSGIDLKYMNDYIPTQEDTQLIQQRINSKLKQ